MLLLLFFCLLMLLMLFCLVFSLFKFVVCVVLFVVCCCFACICYGLFLGGRLDPGSRVVYRPHFFHYLFSRVPQRQKLPTQMTEQRSQRHHGIHVEHAASRAVVHHARDVAHRSNRLHSLVLLVTFAPNCLHEDPKHRSASAAKHFQSEYTSSKGLHVFVCFRMRFMVFLQGDQ